MSSLLFANHEIFCFDCSQNIANYTFTLEIRNDYQLAKINEIIRGILERGLSVKWQRPYVWNRLYFLKKKKRAQTAKKRKFWTTLKIIIDGRRHKPKLKEK